MENVTTLINNNKSLLLVLLMILLVIEMLNFELIGDRLNTSIFYLILEIKMGPNTTATIFRKHS